MLGGVQGALGPGSTQEGQRRLRRGSDSRVPRDRRIIRSSVGGRDAGRLLRMRPCHVQGPGADKVVGDGVGPGSGEASGREVAGETGVCPQEPAPVSLFSG